MSDNDATRDDAEHRSLSAALTDLAATMPDESYPVDAIHAKGRQLRKRQRAARATVSVVAGVAVVVALVAVLPERSPVSTAPASQVPIAGRSCAEALTAAPPAPTPVEVRAAEAAKQAAAGDAGANLRGIKALGTIVSATDTTVTITPDPQMSDQLGEITATVSPAAEFYDGDTRVDTRPPLAPGDQVMFVASRADDGSYQLVLLAVHVPEHVGSTKDTVVGPAKSAPEQAASSDAYVKGSVVLVSVQPDSLTIRFTDGEQAGQVVTAAVGPDTVYEAGGQQCIDPALTTDQKVGILLARDGNGAFSVDTVALETPPPPKPSAP